MKRRDFLRMVGLGSLAGIAAAKLPAPPVLPPARPLWLADWAPNGKEEYLHTLPASAVYDGPFPVLRDGDTMTIETTIGFDYCSATEAGDHNSTYILRIGPDGSLYASGQFSDEA